MKLKTALDYFKQYHPNRDYREFLDFYFWSYIVKRRTGYEEFDSWCNEQFGEDNWIRIDRKIWLTSKTEFFHFRLVWEDEIDFKQLEYDN